ncbi:MAG: hypothetical protein QM598_05675 [Protaetiibacter sp.]
MSGRTPPPLRFSAEVVPVRYGLDRNTGIVLDVIEQRPTATSKYATGVSFSLECGDWGLALTIRGDELVELHKQLGQVVARLTPEPGGSE